ncbi:MAG: cobalamin biosynthesis protein CbiD [Magnetococcales bacterium]|uniref:Cobalt-precorrin-5B C(1)-methyltransferase n=1 Tax=Candidatus Magnetobacterium casense TaxID=1455061 RepID=A0ABS6RVG9_9BACT|nr:cobalt-precorrin-5B (C(1))-methyltransferase CbiD [Candidatus Magnetobacterium casensis]MBF0608514.1 cobalamin biosynthesis protein CbiD [Nitrospirota bacterium]MBV6340621.1 cobalamin biosynthesis protein CbiD [Candidatus Magnetobacterium casensis]
MSRNGFTTGTAAAAAAKASAIRLLTGTTPESVSVTLPQGDVLHINVSDTTGSYVAVVKDAGSDPDVTDGIEVLARVRRNDTDRGVCVKGGYGVGRVTRPGLQVGVGQAAINPAPGQMIINAVREVIVDGGVEVEVAVPRGIDCARRTFNPRLGIVDGISILGTTGIVRPMSTEALKATIKCETDVSFEQDNCTVYMAPGGIGETALKAMFEGIGVVQFSNYLGYALSYARQKGLRHVVIGGHPGKLAKVLMGYLDTHSSRSPTAVDFIKGFFGLKDNFNTVEEVIQVLRTGDVTTQGGFSLLAAAIAARLKAEFGFDSVEVCLFDMGRRLIGHSR